MTIRVQTVRFDRYTPHGRPAAMPVPVQRGDPIPEVDWRSDAGIATAVAYPLALTEADVASLSVTVTFAVGEPPPGGIVVRARPEGGRLLGEVAATAIAAEDLGRPQGFALAGVQLRDALVGDHTVVWIWEYRERAARDWTRFDRSIHRVFVTVDDPAPPWGRPGVPHTIVPWEAFMALACRWAAGLRDAEDVRAAMTAAVDGLAGRRVGTHVLEYHPIGSLCVDRIFFLDDFMSMVNGCPRVANWLNCRDLNSAVATATSVLGVELRMLYLHHAKPEGTIRTNPIKLFGRTVASALDFIYHEVAAAPAASLGEREVSDACVRIDHDNRPAQNPPARFRLATGLAMDRNRFDLGYRERLLVTGSQTCKIENALGDGIRYPEELPRDGAAPGEPDHFIQERRDYYAAMIRAAADDAKHPWLPGGFLHPLGQSFREWLDENTDSTGFRRRVAARDNAEPDAPMLRFTPIKPEVVGGRSVVTSVLKGATREQAIEILATVAGDYPGVLERVEPTPGDFSLHDPAGGTLFMLRGDIVAVMHGEGVLQLPADTLVTTARGLDEKLIRFAALRSEP